MRPAFLITLILSIISYAVADAGLVKRLDAPEAPGGLDGRHIALWPSHGYYYDSSDGRWKWQRGRLFGTVEDLFSESFVVPLLIPMLENAGACVLTPRERDINTNEIIIDRDGGRSSGHVDLHSTNNHKWEKCIDQPGFVYRTPILEGTVNPFAEGSADFVTTSADPDNAPSACWWGAIPEDGDYAIYVSYISTPESAPDAHYTVNSAAGQEEFEVDQRMGGGTWIYLGTFPFKKGHSDEPLVVLTGSSSRRSSIVSADAVKIGGGMGNVARGGNTSAYPRHCEGARYWLQWAGIPDSVYSVTAGENDYIDDYKSRGLWVNYLSGGSRSNPDAEGLGIPIDLSFALHTDAGVTTDSSTIGTLGIVSYGRKDRLGDGRLRSTADDYARAVTSQIVNDIRAIYNPSWNQRATRNRQYHEASSPVVPALLVELLSHQNRADMEYGLDPAFRFNVARSIYKGMLRYLGASDGRQCVIQPLPVNSFAISGQASDYILSWKPTPDPLEPSALPTYYIIEERIADGAFHELAISEDPWITVNIDTNDIYSYRVRAANRGGVSFPSETLSLCRKGDASRQVMIVNGYTRISGPDTTEGGFDYLTDHGSPYLYDTAFTGEQTEFRADRPWVSNDAPGAGASRAWYERNVMAGNNGDFVSIHGEALRRAGIPFISASADGFTSSMPEVRYIDLILGKQKEVMRPDGSAAYPVVSEEMVSALSRFLDSGGRLLVSGSYISSDIFDNPHTGSDIRRWARRYLGIDHSSGRATVTGQVEMIKSRFKSFHPASLSFCQKLNGEIYAVESPDAFNSTSPSSATVMRYTENGLSAAVATETDSFKTVTIGFPLETVTGSSQLQAIMTDVMTFFDAPITPVISNPASAATKKNTVNKKTKKKKSGKTKKKSKKK
ncbi:MAG: hypothetical protein NC098_09035 [Lachnoclostridium sp.]|nr:hypothetical protein [Lachnoclostridium sp.]